MRTVLYILKTGDVDEQQPHELIEVYYIIQGRGMLSVDAGTFEVAAGEVVYVAVHAGHRFFDIQRIYTSSYSFRKPNRKPVFER